MIITADLHLRRTAPINRIDDYWKTQQRKFMSILELANKWPPLLIVAGDFFDKARPGEYLETWVMECLKATAMWGRVVVVPGQHDMPYNTVHNMGDSGLRLLQEAGAIHVLINQSIVVEEFSTKILVWGTAFGETPPPDLGVDWRADVVLIWHTMVSQAAMWPGHKFITPQKLLDQYPHTTLIITGDNHQTLSHLNIGRGAHRWWINPGSMMRLTTAQRHHIPGVFQWHPNTAPKFLPLTIDPWHRVFAIEDQEVTEKHTAIQAFVQRLRTDHEIGLSFEINLREYLANNEVEPDVERLIWECVGE